ncbi:rod shape-determining protein RodA [Brevibacillus ruminantium]|uniref:Rod shape-determining protein RodA n=1 Tax=Brevibacillus ruminantium TaxID=2950604 RepID=A0ABY4WLL3_9BACL|nr:rod shape-determining protein RodA [Brevibacillus ruminantium]USG67028.1 rod shape-determining protein RodA [Brevibacillus ruminantium]
MFSRKMFLRVDFVLIFSVLALSILSTLAIYSTTVNRNGMEDWYQKQIVWQIISVVSMIAFAFLDHRILKGLLSYIGYFLCICLLICVFFYPAKNGAQCWITLPGGFQFQPSELTKIFVILTISDFMTRARQKNESFGWKHLFVILGINLVPFVLILKQPHLGQALTLLGITGAMMILFLSRKQLLVYLVSVAVLISAIFIAKTAFTEQSIEFVEKLPFMNHQKERIITFLDSEIDKAGASYQVLQAKMAIGSGQLMGRGIVSGTATQGNWVPEQWTDFIFSAIGEELGFLGASFLLTLFFFLLYRLTAIAVQSEDYFSTCFITGVIGMFTFQIIENVGMNLDMMPVTGITLPFVSYGGTSLLTNFVILGIVLSMKIRTNRLTFS